MVAAATSPMSRYGTVFPTISSSGCTGETVSCSMVPRSFSRTMERAVDMTADIMRMRTISPGTRKLALRSSGLKSTRGRKSMVDLHPRHAGPLQGTHECALRVVGGQRLHVADCRGRGVPVGAVNDGLHLDPSSRSARVAAEPARDHERDERPSLVQQPVDLSVSVSSTFRSKYSECRNELEKAPARLRPVVVQDSEGDVRDVEADGEAEHQEQEEGHDEKHPEGGGIPRNLAKLLDHDRGDARAAHRLLPLPAIDQADEHVLQGRHDPRDGCQRSTPRTLSAASACSISSSRSRLTCRRVPKMAVSRTAGTPRSAAMACHRIRAFHLEDGAGDHLALERAGASPGDDPARVHEDQLVAVLRLVQVVGGDEHRGSAAAPAR